MLLQIILVDGNKSMTISGVRLSSSAIKIKYVAEQSDDIEKGTLYQTFSSYTIVEITNVDDSI
jgi:hypothetical protein